MTKKDYVQKAERSSLSDKDISSRLIRVMTGGDQTGWKDPETGNLYNLSGSVVLIPVDRALREYAERRASNLS